MRPSRDGSIRTRRRLPSWAIWVFALAFGLAACTPSSESGETDRSIDVQSNQTMVEPNFEANTVVINVTLTDDGFEPSTILIPAGHPIRLILRNHGSREHHFRIGGLIPSHMSWLLYPEISEYELDTMDAEELAALGIGGDVDDVDHVLHHLTPAFVPFKNVSPNGVKPLPNEVHGYVNIGTLDVMEFFATNTGVFTSEDVLDPEITGRVIVFEVDA